MRTVVVEGKSVRLKIVGKSRASSKHVTFQYKSGCITATTVGGKRLCYVFSVLPDIIGEGFTAQSLARELSSEQNPPADLTNKLLSTIAFLRELNRPLSNKR